VVKNDSAGKGMYKKIGDTAFEPPGRIAKIVAKCEKEKISKKKWQQKLKKFKNFTKLPVKPAN